MPTFHTNREITANRKKYARRRRLRPGTRAYEKYVYGGGSKQFAHGKAGKGSRHAGKRK